LPGIFCPPARIRRVRWALPHRNAAGQGICREFRESAPERRIRWGFRTIAAVPGKFAGNSRAGAKAADSLGCSRGSSGPGNFAGKWARTASDSARRRRISPLPCRTDAYVAPACDPVAANPISREHGNFSGGASGHRTVLSRSQRRSASPRAKSAPRRNEEILHNAAHAKGRAVDCRSHRWSAQRRIRPFGLMHGTAIRALPLDIPPI
jgi:hypothetical protein